MLYVAATSLVASMGNAATGYHGRVKESISHDVKYLLAAGERYSAGPQWSAWHSFCISRIPDALPRLESCCVRQARPEGDALGVSISQVAFRSRAFSA